VTLRTPQTLLVAALVTLAMLIAAGGYLAVVVPQTTKANDLASQLASAQAKLIRSPVPHKTGNATQATDLFRLTEAMPNSDDMPGILLDLSRLAQASSVTIASVQPSPLVALTQGYSALPIAVVVNGKYDAVSAFLGRMRQAVQIRGSRLEVDGRFFVVNQMALTTTDGKTVDATLNLDAFVYGAAPATSSTAGTPGTSSTTTTTTATTTTTSSD